MGACNVNLPTIVVSSKPVLTGRHKGKSISTSDIWRFSEANRAEQANDMGMTLAEEGMCCSEGIVR